MTSGKPGYGPWKEKSGLFKTNSTTVTHIMNIGTPAMMLITKEAIPVPEFFRSVCDGGLSGWAGSL